MKIFLVRTIVLFGFTLLLALAVSAQNGDRSHDDSDSGVPEKVLNGTGKATVIVVGSAAKLGWKATKFTGQHVAKPAAKFIFLRAAPSAGSFLLRHSRVVAKHALPIAVKYAAL